MALEELPEVEEEGLALHERVVHGPGVGGQDLGGDEGISVALLFAVLLAGAGSPREGPACALAVLVLVLLVLLVVGDVGAAGDGFELGSDDVFEKFLEDEGVSEIFDEPRIVLLQLLHQVALVEKLLEREALPLEDLVDGRDIGVAAKPPKHDGRRPMGAMSQRRR